MRTPVFFLCLLAACDESMQGVQYPDMTTWPFKSAGAPCSPDVPPGSQCGYPPRYFCAASGVCASYCNADPDCRDGAKCIGAGDMSAGTCRLARAADGGHD